jgi:hypothetical protein
LLQERYVTHKISDNQQGDPFHRKLKNLWASIKYSWFYDFELMISKNTLFILRLSLAYKKIARKHSSLCFSFLEDKFLKIKFVLSSLKLAQSLIPNKPGFRSLQIFPKSAEIEGPNLKNFKFYKGNLKFCWKIS